MSKQYIDDETLQIVSGGKLLDNWQETLMDMMRIYKAKYGDEGLQKILDLIIVSVNDETSPVEAQDYDTICNFIRNYWERAVPWNLQ